MTLIGFCTSAGATLIRANEIHADLFRAAYESVDTMPASDVRAVVIAFSLLLAVVDVTTRLRRWRSR